MLENLRGKCGLCAAKSQVNNTLIGSGKVNNQRVRGSKKNIWWLKVKKQSGKPSREWLGFKVASDALSRPFSIFSSTVVKEVIL
jgi:hypothetical protein